MVAGRLMRQQCKEVNVAAALRFTGAIASQTDRETMLMRLIDLSFTIEDEMPVYPGDVHTSIRKLDDPKMLQAGWTAHNITMSLHAGTHVESPAHSIPGGKMLSAYPLETFCGEAHIIKRKDIGCFKVDTPILIAYSGYDEIWGEEEYFSPPPLTTEQAKWIAESGVKIFATDTISVGDVMIHRTIQERNILIVESMANVNQLLHQKVKLYLFPLRIDKEASPVRAVAEHHQALTGMHA
jgi:kynurenine formamidase